MTNPADTPEVEVDQAVQGVIVAIRRLADLAGRWPHLVREQLKDIEVACGLLELIITYLYVRGKAEKQVGEPVDFLGEG